MRYVELVENEPPDIDENLKQINLFVNDNCTAEDLWKFFTKGGGNAFNIDIVSDLLYSSLKWHSEIFHQRPLVIPTAKEDLHVLYDQIKIDKPRVFSGGIVTRRWFCELAVYLKLMYAGSATDLKQKNPSSHKATDEVAEGTFETDDEELSVPVIAFNRIDEFSHQRLPTVPFPCGIVESSSVKAWTSTLKKLNHMQINELRGETGKAIDWNKLNDTFLVDFKGKMYWLPRDSIQPHTEEKAVEPKAEVRSEAETTPSSPTGAGRSEGRSTTPARINILSRTGSSSSKNSMTSPSSPQPTFNITQLRQRFREGMSLTPQRKNAGAGHRAYHSLGSRSASENNQFQQQLYTVIKGAPPTDDVDDDQEEESSYQSQKHNRSYSDRNSFRSRKSRYSSFDKDSKPSIEAVLTDDLARLIEFFHEYNVPAKDVDAICGRRIKMSKWDDQHNQGCINLAGQDIWLPPELATRVTNVPPTPLRTHSAVPDQGTFRLRRPRTPTMPFHRSVSAARSYSAGRSISAPRSLSAFSNKYWQEKDRHKEKKKLTESRPRSISMGYRQDRPQTSRNSVASEGPSSLVTPSHSTMPSMSPHSVSPGILMDPNRNRNRSKSKSPKKKTKFSLVKQVIPSPGFYYIQRNRNLIFKKCTIHRLDSRRLLTLMGRRVEITHINREHCGTFMHADRTYLIPMDCLTIDRAIRSPD